MTRASCPDICNWQALLDENDPASDSPELAEHLASCSVCQETLEILAADRRSWENVSVGLVEKSRTEPALRDMVERLKNMDSLPVEDEDLSYLQPAGKPGLLGLLGPYEVENVIGRGGMGVVLKAFEPALNRPVAIKVLSSTLAGSNTARRRFTREAKAAAAINHDHVVAIHGVFEADGLPYLVMQYVAGESLQDRLDREGALDIESAVHIGIQTAQGLAAAHAQGLVHRDIKPANILLSFSHDAGRVSHGTDGTDGPDESYQSHPSHPSHRVMVKITDFGLARMTDDVGLTQNGVIAGTPEYMAPEQARGESIDHRADLFSLGSVLSACCTGRPPFRGATAVAVLRQVSDEEPVPVRSLNPDVPEWLETIMSRLMAKDPALRIQSAAETASLLEAYLGHLQQPVSMPAPQLPTIRDGGAIRKGESDGVWWLSRIVGLVALVVVAVAMAVFSLFQADRSGAPEPTGEFFQDFRGGQAPLPPLGFYGPDPEEVTRPEAGGFRITLPRDRKHNERAGLELKTRVKGDFEITSSYEILKADRPKEGHGVGFDLFIETDTPRHDVAEVARATRVNDGEVYTCSRISTDDQGKRTYQHHFPPASGKSGQLRLSRIGREVTLWAAEGLAGEFKELCRYDLGTEDVILIAAIAFPGYAPNFLDLRILDLRVHMLNAADATALEASSAQQAKDGSMAWFMAAGLMGLLIVLTALALWFIGTRGRRAGARSPEAPADNQPLANEESPSISLKCSGCGTTLKARAFMAGKKVRCPKCGAANLISATKPDKSGRMKSLDLSPVQQKAMSHRRFPRLLFLAAFAPLAGLASGVIALGFTDPPHEQRDQKELSEVFHHDFRRPVPRELAGFNSEDGRFFREEAEGLRISLPRTWIHPWGGVGFRSSFGFGGDFEVTTAFEILKADVPPDGFGVGMSMRVNKTAPSPGGATLCRVVRAGGNEVVLWDMMIEPAANQKPRTRQGVSPCSEKVVRLRLKRTGSTLHYLWAPGIAGDGFQEIHHEEFGDEDIDSVRLSTLTGRKSCDVDVRLLDFRVLSTRQPADSPAAGTESARGNRWLAAALIAGLVMIFSFALGAWLLLPDDRYGGRWTVVIFILLSVVSFAAMGAWFLLRLRWRAIRS